MTFTIDTVVVGGSAGSTEALKTLLPKLPADLPAAIFICQHRSPESIFAAPQYLQSYSKLPLREAVDGQPIELGQIVFAPFGTHLLLGDGHVHLRRGAQENNFRPAIDPLFRSAAMYRSTRVIGVILSGFLDDGAAGARAIARTGGRVLAQDPGTTEFPDMPRATLQAVEGCQAFLLEEIADQLAALVGTPCSPRAEIPMDIGIEVKIAGLEGASMSNEEKLGVLSPYNCPDCNGVLWEIADGPLSRFRCHTGHAYTIRSLDQCQSEALERSLFEALRAHRGRASLLRKLASSAGEHGTERLLARAKLVEEDATRLEGILLSRAPITKDDTVEPG